MQAYKHVTTRIMRSEEKVSSKINILGHYDAETLIDKNGRLIKLFKLAGLPFETQSEQLLDIYKNRRNNFFKNFSSQFALYFWQIKKKGFDYPQGEYKQAFSRHLNDKYYANLKQKNLFNTELYMAVIAKEPEGMLNKGFTIIKGFNHRFDKHTKEEYLKQKSRALNEVSKNILSHFADYHCKLLSVYEKNNVAFSQALEFVSQLINFNSVSVPLQINDASKVLPRKRLSFNDRAGVIEARSADNQKKFAAVLSIKAYSPFTHQGMLNALSLIRSEYVITQSFRFYDKYHTKTRLRDQQKELVQSKDESITQTEQIDQAFDHAASGEVGYGKHHLTITCYAGAQTELDKHISDIIAAFADVDITCVRETIACELAFWAQLPGNFGYIARPADISTKNLAALASFHNFPQGKLKDNHWGDAVTVLETISGSPYYFNFHYRDVGNFLVFGAMGSGKSVLVGFLIAQSLKFGGKRVIFDKDRGLEILVRALRGSYEIMKPGKPTGFNPCQLEDTAENRQFLSSLFKKLTTANSGTFSELDAAIIQQVIEGLYRLEKSDRQFCNIAPLFGNKKSSALRARFDQWHSEGRHAWVFDNAVDTLNLNHNVMGFDLGHILKAGECKGPALMYLLYRVEQAMAGQRGLLFCDECWLLLDDEDLRKFFEDWSRTSRKKDNIFGLATQVVSDITAIHISKAINESAACKIFFPNPSADRSVYVNQLGLSEYEFQRIKTLPDDQRFFLLVHGLGANKQSAIVHLSLDGFDDELAVISARESTLLLFDQIFAEVGDDANIWLPAFHARRRLLRA